MTEIVDDTKTISIGEDTNHSIIVMIIVALILLYILMR